jgi:hypothetical protein
LEAFIEEKYNKASEYSQTLYTEKHYEFFKKGIPIELLIDVNECIVKNIPLLLIGQNAIVKEVSDYRS